MLAIDLLFGGVSFEHEISIVSAVALKKRLEKSSKIKIEKFIFLDKNHRFFLVPQESVKSKFFSSGEYQKCQEIHLKNGGFFSAESFFGKSKSLPLNVVVSLVHGADGEDGILSNLLEFFNVPFIAPRGAASVLSFDKELTKIYAKSRGVSVLDYEILSNESVSKIALNLPLILKPARLGSSLGVSVAKDEKSLIYAKDLAAEYDSKIIAEPFISGIKEYNLAGCKVGSDFIFSIIEEPQKKDLLDFENKYLDFNRSEKIAVAEIDSILESKLKNAFVKIYENCFEGALIRCDFFEKNGEVLLNEINPIPGSLANYLFSNFDEVLVRLAQHLPRKKHIEISYKYIEKIHGFKGK